MSCSRVNFDHLNHVWEHAVLSPIMRILLFSISTYGLNSCIADRLSLATVKPLDKQMWLSSSKTLAMNSVCVCVCWNETFPHFYQREKEFELNNVYDGEKKSWKIRKRNMHAMWFFFELSLVNEGIWMCVCVVEKLFDCVCCISDACVIHFHFGMTKVQWTLVHSSLQWTHRLTTRN